MVLEHAVPDRLWKRRFSYALLVSFVYSVVSIVIAGKVFSANPGIVSVMFLTLFLLPSLRKLFVEEEQMEEKERSFSLKHLWKDNHRTVRVYCGLFSGVFLAYLLTAFLLPQLGYEAVDVVREQLFLSPAVKGNAFNIGTAVDILANNWYVLLIAFLFAIAWSDGAFFFVSWNASAWGAIFGYRAVTAAWQTGVNPLYYLLVELGIVVWHTALEGGAYILAAISGSVISEEVVKNSDELHRFLLVGGCALLAGIGIDWILSTFVGVIWETVLMILVMFALVYTLHFAFTDPDHKEVFIYNYWLFVGAILLFIVGAVVETLVLENSGLLREIYRASRAFALQG